MHRFGEEAMSSSRHPCFSAAAHGKYARIHLPVAPDCNIVCAYCNRKNDCVHESRPGVCSRILAPEEAADLVDRAVHRLPSLAVVGIAGPGDALAVPETTLCTLALIRARHPGLLLCLSTNGLALAEHVSELKSLGVGHVTVTINAVDAAVGERICRAVRLKGHTHTGPEAAELLLERQTRALAALKAHGIAVKVNTVIIPGINDLHVRDIARHIARFGVDLMNCIGLIPVPGTTMQGVKAPSARQMETVRKSAGEYVPQMRHCARCRADAFGLLSEPSTIEALQPLSTEAPSRCFQQKPACRSEDGPRLQ
jgi:nitrogen fixation protein NifB